MRKRRPELETHIRKRVGERNGPEAILFTSGPHSGKTLAQLAQQTGKSYEKVLIDDIGYGGPAQAHFLMAPVVQEAFITADYINICTDGAPGPGHPRSYDSFVKVLDDYVGVPPKMSFERAIYKMSGLPAQSLGLDRGTLAVGRKADMLVLSPAELHSRVTWTEQQLSPTGIDLILVNGQVAFETGRATGKRHGRMLRRSAGSQQNTKEHERQPETAARGRDGDDQRDAERARADAIELGQRDVQPDRGHAADHEYLGQRLARAGRLQP